MMYSMWTLHYREISLAETLRSSLHMILGWYQNTGDKKLLELIRLHLQAYVNTGNSLNPEMEEIRTALGNVRARSGGISTGCRFWWQKDSADKDAGAQHDRQMASDKGKPDEHS